jgi:hypothetical protein
MSPRCANSSVPHAHPADPDRWASSERLTGHQISQKPGQVEWFAPEVCLKELAKNLLLNLPHQTTSLLMQFAQ